MREARGRRGSEAEFVWSFWGQTGISDDVLLSPGLRAFPRAGVRGQGAPPLGECASRFEADGEGSELISHLFLSRLHSTSALRAERHILAWHVLTPSTSILGVVGSWGVTRDWRTQSPLAVQKEVQGFFKSLKGSQKSIILCAISQF